LILPQPSSPSTPLHLSMLKPTTLLLLHSTLLPSRPRLNQSPTRIPSWRSPSRHSLLTQPLIAPSNKTIDPLTNNADLGVVTDIPLPTFSSPAPNDTPPANTQSSLANSLTAPQETSVSDHRLANDTASFTRIDRPE
ncbi:hypothetical protein BGW80DRAFT_1420358, partial [Lactifluus volemus]